MRFPLPHPDHEWQRVSTVALCGWLAFYALSMYAYREGGAHYLDAVHLVTHEAGHPLFSYTGSEFLTVFGGTLLQLFVPAALAVSFAWRGHTLGTVFSAWLFFNSFIPMAIYMMDARAKGLALVAPGVASEDVEGHDWEYILQTLGLIQHDLTIGRVFTLLGWVGMWACVAWLLYRWRVSQKEAAEEAAAG